MEFLDTFGINPILLLAQIVNFLILFFVLKRFFYKPVLKNLEERRKTIEKGLEDAKKSEELLEKTKVEEQKILKDAQDTASKIVQEARTDAEQIRIAQAEQLKVEKEKMLSEAKQQIEQERNQIEQELMKKIVTIATSLVEQALKGMLRSEDRKRIEERVEKGLYEAKNI